METKYKYFCEICQHICLSRQALYQHKKSKKHIGVLQQSIPSNLRQNPSNSVKFTSKIDGEIFSCRFCSKIFSRKHNLKVHLSKNRCKKKRESESLSKDSNVNVLIKKVDRIVEALNESKEENKEIKEVLEETLEELGKTKEELAQYKCTSIINTNSYYNNLNNYNTTNNIETMNLNNINNLNMNFANVIPMETFLYNMEYVNKISITDVENLLYSSKNMGIEDLANCFEKIISKNCIEQTKHMRDENGEKILPALPVLCTDGNMRTHKERLVKSWDTMYNDIHFAKMWEIVNNRVYELTNEYIHVPQKHKKKLYSRIKKKVCVKDLIEMQNLINNN